MSQQLETFIMEISRKLSKMIEGDKATDNAVELISALEEAQVNIDVLTKTRIGMVLNEFRKKTTDEKLAKRCKLLIKRWKTLLDEKIGNRSKSPEERSASIAKEEKATTSITNKQLDHRQQKPNGTMSTVSGGTGTDVRSKSVQLLLNALTSGEVPNDALQPEEVAKRVEERLFEHHRGVGDKYKAALRSRVFNLRDKKNNALRVNVLTGAVSAEKFAVMTADEMASEEMKKVRENLTKESILEHQMSVQEGTPTDMFRCHKCGSKVCTYSQMQTRSADEPMTTFVFCRSCGNRWKFC